MKRICPSLAILMSVAVVGCHTGTVGRSPSYATPDDVGRQFVAGMSSGRIEAVEKVYIPLSEFEATFAGQGLPEVHETLVVEFRKSLGKMMRELKGATFVGMNMENCPEPILAPAGATFGLLTFERSTPALDNIRVFVEVAGTRKEIKLDALVKVGDSWRLVSPDIALLPRG